MITTILPLVLFVGLVMTAAGMATGAFTPTVRAVNPPEQCPCGRGFIGPGHTCGGGQ